MRPELEGIPSKIDCNELDPKLILSTSGKGVYIYDLRNLDKRLYTFNHHSKRVRQALWSPHNPAVFASSGDDRRVCIMDIEKIEIPRFSDDFHNTMQALLVNSLLI